MLQGSVASRSLPSLSLAVLLLTLLTGNPLAAQHSDSTSHVQHTDEKWLCSVGDNGVRTCTEYEDRLPTDLQLHSVTIPPQVPVHTTRHKSKVTSTAKPTTSAPVTVVNKAAFCPGSGLPAIGTVVGAMHWVDGIPSDSCAASQSAPYNGVLRLWQTPPAPFNRVYYPNPSAFPSRGGWPTCTWWARETGVNFGLNRGAYGSVPKVGATIVYAPGVLGASSDGHYGHVVQVYNNGWILTSEMNFYWNGGGAGRVIFRFIPWHTSGISFIY